ncbi:hypothetical protein SNE40_014032 [Patella caerulea]|uniref:Uncharacterized protein n=1 Tax=Patella caerulea TaxID=87958 RepID=A0AAN8PRY4_PATCE
MEVIKSSIQANLQVHRRLTEVREEDEISSLLSDHSQTNSPTSDIKNTQSTSQKKPGTKRDSGRLLETRSYESLKRLQNIHRMDTQTVKTTEKKVHFNKGRRSEKEIQNIRHRKELMFRSAEHNKYVTELILAQNPLPSHSLFPLS